MTLSEYLALITSEHQGKANYIAVISALMSGPTDITNLDLLLPSYFDLDTATGVQLDAIGEWVGISRRVAIPLRGVYFEWDTLAVVGWDSGAWKGDLDPDAGVVSLSDGDYRTLIRGKIAANNWDGTVPGAVAALHLVFPEQLIVMQDNQDMSMDLMFFGPPLTAIERALILGDYLLLRPFTVQTHTYSIQPIAPFNGEGWLTWDDTAATGWGSAYWFTPLLIWDDDTLTPQPAQDWFTWDDTVATGWNAGFWYLPIYMHGWGDAHWALGGPIFAWDTETVEFSGWDTGGWVGPLLP